MTHEYGTKAWSLEWMAAFDSKWFRLFKAETLESAIEITRQMEGPRLVPDRYRLVNVATDEKIPVAILAL